MSGSVSIIVTEFGITSEFSSLHRPEVRPKYLKEWIFYVWHFLGTCPHLGPQWATHSETPLTDSEKTRRRRAQQEGRSGTLDFLHWFTRTMRFLLAWFFY